MFDSHRSPSDDQGTQGRQRGVVLIRHHILVAGTFAHWVVDFAQVKSVFSIVKADLLQNRHISNEYFFFNSDELQPIKILFILTIKDSTYDGQQPAQTDAPVDHHYPNWKRPLYIVLGHAEDNAHHLP